MSPVRDQNSTARRRSGKKAKKGYRTKLPASQTPPFSPLQFYRPGRICLLLDVDKSTLWRMQKRKIFPPYTTLEGTNIKGLTGEQLQKYLAQRADASDPDLTTK